MISCPKCKNKTLRTINSRPNKIEDAVWRQRKCQKCKYVFQTAERVIDDIPTTHTQNRPKAAQRPLKRQQRHKNKVNIALLDLESLSDEELEELMFSNPDMFNDDKL